MSTVGNEQVDQFHAAALQLGAKDNGAPGLRPQYHEGYYGGAFSVSKISVHLLL